MSAVKEFKVGQRWKTRGGKVETITSIDDSADANTYPVNTSTGCFTFEGREWQGDTSLGDLVQLISDEHGNVLDSAFVTGTSVGRTFRQDLVLALVSGLAAGGASPQHLVGDVNSLVDQLDDTYGDKA